MNTYKINTISNIKFGDIQVKKVYLGSKLLWSSTFDNNYLLTPIVMDSAGNLKTSWNTVTLDSMKIITTGNTSFIIKSFDDIDTSKIEIEYPYEVDSYNRGCPKIIVNKIDDYALYIHRFYGYNVWRGGTNSSIWDETLTFNYFNHLKTLKLYGWTDENNKTFINGLYVNKVIKSPSKGSNGIVKIKFFPYTFNDEFFVMDSFKLYYINYYDRSNDGRNLYLWNNLDKVFINKNDNNDVLTLNDTIFSSFNITYEGLEGTIEYTIKPNNTNEFKDAALCTEDALVHFIQEPFNNHRIYITEFYDHSYTTNQYLDSQENENEYLFHVSGSKIIDRSLVIEANYKKGIMYPILLENEYDISIEGDYEYKSINIWDNLSYKHYVLKKYAKIIFNKK